MNIYTKFCIHTYEYTLLTYTGISNLFLHSNTLGNIDKSDRMLRLTFHPEANKDPSNSGDINLGLRFPQTAVSLDKLTNESGYVCICLYYCLYLVVSIARGRWYQSVKVFVMTQEVILNEYEYIKYEYTNHRILKEST